MTRSHDFQQCRARSPETVKRKACEHKSGVCGRYLSRSGTKRPASFYPPTFPFPPSLDVTTQKPTNTLSTSLADSFTLLESIVRFEYRYRPKPFLNLTAHHHLPQWLNTPTKWIDFFGQSCHKLLKSCTTSLHLKVSHCGRSCLMQA